MNARLALAVLVAVTACSGSGGSGDVETRTIPLAHLSVQNALTLVEPYVPGGMENISAIENPAALTISASTERIEQIEELLRRYDVVRQVRLHFQVIEADGFTTRDSAIADVEASLRQLFRFTGYRLASEAVLTGQAHTDVTQRIQGMADTPLVITSAIGNVTTAGDRSAVELIVELSTAMGGTLLRTGVTVPNGQTVVLGSAEPFEGVGAIILVVRPEIE